MKIICNRKSFLLFIITLFILSLCACGNPSASDAGSGTRTVTDQAGREVVIEGHVERIVSGYYISSSACIALGVADRLVGIEAQAESRPIYALARPELHSLPSVGTAKDFNSEACLALNPDLVILPYRLRSVADTMTEMGVPVILVNPESYEGLIDMIALIGKAVGAAERAERLIAYYEDTRNIIAGQTADLSYRPAVYMCGVGSHLTTASKDMYQTSLIDMAGGRSATGGIDGSGWTKISYEQLLNMDPEVIIIPSEAGYDIETVVDDPVLADITAVKNGMVYKMPSAFEAWDSPVPSCILGVEWLLSVLHRDICPIEDVRRDAVNFYREFYGIEIDASLIGQ